ncbi:hypothetical protein SCARR_04797 [Pontiella sulfatireligans]|uniref:Sulfatase N-terminal domain-containing protein n=1 Tax=Pontiella sulfatireligans TaxID=2750658 RepID=A0A6C2UQX0_9BACT|nr:sulfatase S1_16 [Kiritimatiellales bacterium]VGO22702.1 hypothetical protein SCARR_04797 [Pontiella sulfatireligans]
METKEGDSSRSDDPKLIYSLTRKAENFLEKQADSGEPFFLQVSHYANHLKYQALPETVEKYENERVEFKTEYHHDALWAAMNENLDESVGRILAKLEELGLKESTYVIYTADNGYENKTDAKTPAHERGFYKAYPQRAHKYTLTVVLSNLTVSQEYEVQLFFAQNYNDVNEYIIMDLGAVNEFGSLASTQHRGPDRAGIVITGSFVADASSQMFSINLDGDKGPGKGIISGYQLRAIENPSSELPPNIILIYSDDQGWNSTSTRMDPNVPGSKSDFYQTPNLDRFCAEGMRFADGYSPNNVCGPSRNSILFGVSPSKARIISLTDYSQRQYGDST